MKIIKVNKEHILNEDAVSAGYSSQGYNTSGFSYSIMPLQFNLCQKGNDPEPELKNKAFKYFVGDIVKGFCPYDNKTHKGYVKYMYYTTQDNDMPKLVYVQDCENNDIIPLTPDTLKKIIPEYPSSNVGTNYLGSGSSHIGYDLDNYTANQEVRESFDFNKALINFKKSEINFSKNYNIDQKISNKVSTIYLRDFLEKYLNVSTLLINENNPHIIEIENEYYIVLGKTDDLKFSILSIKAIGNQLYITSKNHYGFNTSPMEDSFDFPNAINDLLNKGYEFNTLIIKDINIKIRNNYKIYLFYNNLIKYNQLPKNIVIENTRKSQVYNINDFSFSIEMPSNFNKINNNFRYDINECIKIKNWLNSCNVNMVIFDPDLITHETYKRLYCSNKYPSHDLQNIDLILFAAKRFYRTIFGNIEKIYNEYNEATQKIIENIEYRQYGLLQPLKFEVWIMDYIPDKFKTEDELKNTYMILTAYILYYTKMPLYVRPIQAAYNFLKNPRLYPTEFSGSYKDIIQFDNNTVDQIKKIINYIAKED